MATRLSGADGGALPLAEVAGELACCVAAPVGEPAADVDAPADCWAGECLPSVAARGYAPPPPASTTMTASARNRPLLPPRGGGPADGGPGWKGGAGGIAGLAEPNGL